MGAHGARHRTGYEVLTLSAGTPPPSAARAVSAVRGRRRRWRAAAAPAPARIAPVEAEARAEREPCASASGPRVAPRTCCAGRPQLVDRQLKEVWASRAMPRDVALVAVGGYGRGELFPYSDVDLLILLPRAGRRRARAQARGADRHAVGHRPRSRPQRAHHRRVRRARGARHHRADDAPRSAAARRQARALRALRRSASRDALDPAAVPAGEAARAAAAPRALRRKPISSPTSRKAPAGCATCRRCCGSRARPASARAGASSRGAASSPPAKRARSSSTSSFLQTLRIRLHYLAGRREDRLLFDHQSALAARVRPARPAASPGERAADAALLPRRQGGVAAEHDPAAEPGRAHHAAARQGLPPDQRALRHARRAAGSRATSGCSSASPARCSRPSCCCSSTTS